jgi:hypothetical protein
VIDLALDERAHGSGLVVRDVAAGDRELGDALLRDLAAADRRRRELQGAEGIDEPRIERDLGLLPAECIDLCDRLDLRGAGRGRLVIAARGEGACEHGDGGHRG